VTSVEVELARRQWEDGHRRFEEESENPARQEVLLLELEAVTDELRRRVGQTFTLLELAQEYAQADEWVREAVGEHARFPGWVRHLTMLQDEAFHLYARGATDYVP
jgi:chorismate-pyruvate lyase